MDKKSQTKKSEEGKLFAETKIKNRGNKHHRSRAAEENHDKIAQRAIYLCQMQKDSDNILRLSGCNRAETHAIYAWN